MNKKKKYIKPTTEIIVTPVESLMLSGSERDENGIHTGGMGQGRQGDEETNKDGEITVDAKPFTFGYNAWEEE